MVVHACLVVLLLLWATQAPQGSAEETGRDVGIVLKRSTSDGVKFEGEEDTLADKTADTNSQNPIPADANEAFPTLAENSNSADALPTDAGVGELAEPGATASSMAAAGGGTRGGAPGELGEKANVEFFGVQGTGTKFVYLVDYSASMNGGPLAAAKQQMIESLQSLDEVHQFQIIFFNASAQPFTIDGRQRIAFATDQNKRMAERLLRGVSAHGGTDRPNALSTALRLGPDVIFFLTDADSPMSAVELQDVARENWRHHASICTIEFGRGPDPKRYNFLKALAEKTGGQYGYVNTNTLRGQ